jgi:hypothetical protein
MPREAIATTDHAHARRALIEGAWASRDAAQGRRHLPWRLESRPQVVQAMRWKAPVRLCQRDRQRRARGQHANRVVVAIPGN